jgi:fructokinase
MHSSFDIVGFGEALFDVVRGDARPGGAPLNMACIAQQLAAPHGGRGVLISRVGQDPLGDQLVAALREAGVDEQHVQRDPDRPTGRVFVNLTDDGEPTYDIVQHVAWDVIQWDPQLEDVAQTAAGVCFGTLAQRDAQSRQTLYRLLGEVRQGTRLLDVNLREDDPDPRMIERSCELADAVKANRHELPRVLDLLGVDDPAAMMRRYRLRLVVHTRGEQGVELIAPDQVVRSRPASASRSPDADAVGAGDAVSAAVLVGLALRRPWQQIADAAHAVGAHVAGQPSATPTLPEHLLKML